MGRLTGGVFDALHSIDTTESNVVRAYRFGYALPLSSLNFWGREGNIRQEDVVENIGMGGGSTIDDSSVVQMGLPGCIIIITDIHKPEVKQQKRQWCKWWKKNNTSESSSPLSARCVARWAEAEDFSEIMISCSMLDDHDPQKISKELHSMAERFGLDTPFLPKVESSAMSHY